MGNKVKYNLKNVHAAKLTETVTDGVKSFSYGTPKAIPGAVSIALDAEGETSPFYADGIVYFRSVTNNGYSGDLEMALVPEWFRTEILQEMAGSSLRPRGTFVAITEPWIVSGPWAAPSAKPLVPHSHPRSPRRWRRAV